MLMVVFGAGASYDSSPNSKPDNDGAGDLRPPLANRLFNDRFDFFDAFERFPQCLPLIPFLRGTAVNVEEVLEQFRVGADRDPRVHVQLAALRYCLQILFQRITPTWHRRTTGVTNYVLLLDQLRRRNLDTEDPILLVTFNYDCLLEYALRSINVVFSSVEDYIASPTVKLLKLHGSSNWGRNVTLPRFAKTNLRGDGLAYSLVEAAADLRSHGGLSDSFRVIPTGSDYASFDANQVLFPAIAVPAKTEKQFECPNEHLDELKRLLPRVTELLAIGWRGSEPHFQRLLREFGRNIGLKIIVSGERQEDFFETESNLRFIGEGALLMPYMGFSEFALSRFLEKHHPGRK